MAALVSLRRSMSAAAAIWFAAVLVLNSVAPSRAATIYESGSLLPLGNGAYNIAGSVGVSDPFAATTAAVLTDASIVVWVPPGMMPQRLVWAIGTTPYGGDVSSGTALSPTSTPVSDPWPAWDVYQCSFPVSGSVAPSQTYYLSLHDSQTNGEPSWNISWALQNGGPANAYWDNNPNTPSEYFVINGTPVPEPATVTLFAAALLGIAAVAGRRWAQRLQRRAGLLPRHERST